MNANGIFDKLLKCYLDIGNIEKYELEEYIIGVVGAEMPASFNKEALKAQSVVARTYALKSIKNNKQLEKIIEEIKKTKNFDGRIILMHVIYDSTLEAVDRLIPDLIKDGYQIVTVSELAEYKGFTLEEGKIYYQFIK